MPEKAFAIHAEPAAIWRALHEELASASDGGYEIEQSVENELLSLWVEVQSGIRANLTYRLIPRDGHTEVVAAMYPEGLRYAIFKILTLGRAEINYEVLLVEGLANLKRAVEAPEP
jgi:hypothetical protein